MAGTAESAFYCVADDRYFLGTVGTINSLRLHGHSEPIHLLDTGLAGWQRELLEPEATVAPAPSEAPPWLLKTFLPLAHPAEVMVLIDTDIVVARPLGELIERAGEVGVLAFENNVDRFAPQWEELLDLGPIRPRRYLSSAFVAFARSPGIEVLSLMESRRGLVDFERTWWRRNEPGYPFLYADQDVLNGILAARLKPERVASLDHRLAPIPPFEGLRVGDERTLRCVYGDGVEPYVVHHYVTKPWLEPTHHGVYSQLLRRLLTASDVAVQVPEKALPLRFRTGPIAYAERKRINLAERLRWRLRGSG